VDCGRKKKIKHEGHEVNKGHEEEKRMGRKEELWRVEIASSEASS
jgi:hypothetical protein